MTQDTTEHRLVRIESKLVQLMYFLGVDPEKRYPKPPHTAQPAQPTQTKETKNVS